MKYRSPTITEKKTHLLKNKFGMCINRCILDCTIEFSGSINGTGICKLSWLLEMLEQDGWQDRP